jgi:putative ABC transport system substrate-binding protein
MQPGGKQACDEFHDQAIFRTCGSDRRDFIRLAGASAAGLLALGASPDRLRIVASLTSLPLDDELTRRNMTDLMNSRIGGLIGGLKQRGWVEGVNIRFELRSSFGGPDRLKAAIQEIIDLKPDVILTGSTVETAAVLAATRTIPIVFATANDPVGNGFVESLAHPGGNVTGFTSSTAEMGGKWLQLIQEATPDLARVGVLFNPASTPRGGRFFLDAIEQEAAATRLPVIRPPSPRQPGSTRRSAVFPDSQGPR